MYNEEETKEDFKRFKELMDALKLKYGENMSVIVASTFILNDEHGFSAVMLNGDIHHCIHGLLKSPAFVEEMCKTIKCIIHHSESDLFRRSIAEQAATVIEIALTKAISMEDTEKAVSRLLKDAGFN